MADTNYITFSDLYLTDYEITDIYAEKQTWIDGVIFDRLSRPRKSSALIYLNGCSGKYTSYSGEETYAPIKSLFCLPEASRYSVLNITSGNADVDAFLIEFNIVKDGKTLTFSDSPFRIGCFNQYYAEKLSREIVSEYERLPRSPGAVKAAIYSFLSLIGKEAIVENSTKTERISAALGFLEKNPFSDITVVELSQMCNMSEGGFRRLFREYMGKSPSRYILGIKTEAAKKMLENSNESVENIAEMLGFETSAYFCRVFKKETGFTPSEYRKYH